MTRTEKESITIMVWATIGFVMCGLVEAATHDWPWAIGSGMAAIGSLIWAHHRASSLSHPQRVKE